MPVRRSSIALFAVALVAPLLVLTGISSRQDLKAAGIAATYVVEDLSALVEEENALPDYAAGNDGRGATDGQDAGRA